MNIRFMTAKTEYQHSSSEMKRGLSDMHLKGVFTAMLLHKTNSKWYIYLASVLLVPVCKA